MLKSLRTQRRILLFLLVAAIALAIAASPAAATTNSPFFEMQKVCCGVPNR